MRKLRFLPAALAGGLCGCTLFSPAVPQSDFTATASNTNGQKVSVSWKNPKNFSTTNLIIGTNPDGSWTVQVGSASSFNDPTTVSAGYNGQIGYLNALDQLLNNAFQNGMKAGAAAAAVGGKQPVKAP